MSHRTIFTAAIVIYSRVGLCAGTWLAGESFGTASDGNGGRHQRAVAAAEAFLAT